jgi:FlaA1/EpsC-like NDP-sugar epimerase
MEILALKRDETWTMKVKNVWISARNSVFRPEAEDVGFRFEQVWLPSSKKAHHSNSPSNFIDEDKPKQSAKAPSNKNHSTIKTTNQSVIQQDVLFLADLPLIFFSPLLSAFIFSSDFSAFSSEFLLKNMIVFTLTIEAAFILFKSYIPSSLDFWTKFLRKCAGPLMLGSGVYYPFARMLDHFEQLSSVAMFGSVVMCGALLAGHRYAAFMIKSSTKFTFPSTLTNALFRHIWTVPQNLFEKMQRFLSVKSASTSEEKFNQNVLFWDERERKAKQDQISMNVLVVGMFDDVERALRSEGQMFNRSFSPIAIITPDKLDFGKYVDEVPVIGCIDFLDECLSDDTFKGIVLIEDSLPPSIVEQVEQCARSKLVSVLTLVQQRYVRRKMQY